MKRDEFLPKIFRVISKIKEGAIESSMNYDKKLKGIKNPKI